MISSWGQSVSLCHDHSLDNVTFIAGALMMVGELIWSFIRKKH